MIGRTLTKQQRRMELRKYMGELMDAYPDKFKSPRQQGMQTWMQLAQSGRAPTDEDAHEVDRLLGAIATMFRRTRQLTDSPLTMGESYTMVTGGASEEVTPDPEALEFAESAEEPDDDAVAFAKTIAMYRSLVASGTASGEELPRLVMAMLDTLPGETNFDLDLKEMLKRFAVVELAFLTDAVESSRWH